LSTYYIPGVVLGATDLSVNKKNVGKINLQKAVAFLYTNNEQIEKKCRKTIPFTIASQTN
jgi:hypothetical protein